MGIDKLFFKSGWEAQKSSASSCVRNLCLPWCICFWMRLNFNGNPYIYSFSSDTVARLRLLAKSGKASLKSCIVNPFSLGSKSLRSWEVRCINTLLVFSVQMRNLLSWATIFPTRSSMRSKGVFFMALFRSGRVRQRSHAHCDCGDMSATQ